MVCRGLPWVARCLALDGPSVGFTNLIRNPSLDLKTTAYYIKYRQSAVLPRIPNSERAAYFPNQILGAAYKRWSL
jgi:hypothetical protein